MGNVEDLDQGFKAAMAELRALGEIQVTVGVHGDAGEKLVKIATINEFGSRAWRPSWKQAYFLGLLIVLGRRPRTAGARMRATREQRAHAFAIARKLRGRTLQIPERSFLRSTFDRELAKLEEGMSRMALKVASGELTAAEAAQKFAVGLAEPLFRKGLLAVQEPPNAPLTVKLKKSSQPLVDHGRLRASIRAVVGPRS